MLSARIVLLAGLMLAFAGRLAAAPPQVSHLFPAGGQRGQKVTVTAAGSFSRWPASTWSSHPGLQITAADEKGKLEVEIGPEVVPGIVWIRLYDEEGASPPRPFLIGTLPEVLEREPNNSPSQAEKLDSSQLVVHGQLAQRGDVDFFAVPLERGQTLVAALEAHESLGAPLDAVLQIASPGNHVLAQSDDGRGLDPLLVFTAPEDGLYLLRLFAFPATPASTIGFAGGSDFVYRLSVTTGGFVDAAFPLAVSAGQPARVELVGWNIPEAARFIELPPSPEGSPAVAFHPQLAGALSLPAVPWASIAESARQRPEEPQALELPASVTGRISEPRETDLYQFTAAKGEKLVFSIESRALGYPLDAHLRLLDRAGKVLAEADDAGQSRDPVLSYEAREDGPLRLEVRDLNRHGGARYFYRLTAGAARPDYGLKLEADSFVVSPGKPLEIPVAIERQQGFTGPIEVRIEGLPEGVTAEPVVSADGESAKSVKLVLAAAAGPASVPIRVVGSANEAGLRHFATAGPAGLSEVWLTVLAPGK